MERELSFKKNIPLYLQIKELLIERINNKIWEPGDIITSEKLLAKELNVSMGTIKKAIDGLVLNNILDRKQGKGTFVKTHDFHRSLFHFFHIVNKDGEKNIPHSKVISLVEKAPKKNEIKALQLDKGETVINVLRVRTLKGKVIILESITLPKIIFKNLLKIQKNQLPNTLYEFYESYFKITIHKAKERISACTPSKKEAEILKISESFPLLKIERLAQTLNKKPVEFRVSKCITTDYFYDTRVL